MPVRLKFMFPLCFTLSLANMLGCGLDDEEEKPLSGQLSGPSAVLFDIDGPLPQFQIEGALFSPRTKSQYHLERLLERAKTDPMVQEVVVHIGRPEISFARAGELAERIAQLAATGKPLTCHLDSPGNLAYWMAARACPRILLSPAGGVEAVGLALEAVFLRELLASLGITADMISVGRFKDAAEPLTRDEMSPAAREAAQDLLTELHKLFVAQIAKGRNLEPQTVQQLIDGGPHPAARAVKLGLADQVSTLGQHLDTLRAKYAGGVVDDYGKKPLEPLSIGELLKLLSGDEPGNAKSSQPHIALIPVVGPIVNGASNELLGGMELVYDMELVDALSEAAQDQSIRAVVLRIDSPGGSALASDNIWQAVRTLATVKPVVASLGDIAASGGYYIASGASEIVTSPTTLTGSIGVVGGKIVLAGAAERIGLKTELMQTGKRAALDSPFRPFSEEERVLLKGLMDETYELFIDRVCKGRGLKRESVLAVAEGRVWTGSQALTRGLVDSTGGLYQAVQRARTLAGVPPTMPVEIHPKPKNFMELISEALSEPDVIAVRVARKHPVGQRALALTSLLMKHRVLTFSPVAFMIR